MASRILQCGRWVGSTHLREDAQEFTLRLGCDRITRYGAATVFEEGSWAGPELAFVQRSAERQD